MNVHVPVAWIGSWVIETKHVQDHHLSTACKFVTIIPLLPIYGISTYYRAISYTATGRCSEEEPLRPEQLTPEQRRAAERALGGENLFLTGAAGTGRLGWRPRSGEGGG